MEDTIMRDLRNWRDTHALAGSIWRYNQTWIDRLNKIRDEIYLEWKKWVGYSKEKWVYFR